MAGGMVKGGRRAVHGGAPSGASARERLGLTVSFLDDAVLAQCTTDAAGVRKGRRQERDGWLRAWHVPRALGDMA